MTSRSFPSGPEPHSMHLLRPAPPRPLRPRRQHPRLVEAPVVLQPRDEGPHRGAQACRARGRLLPELPRRPPRADTGQLQGPPAVRRGREVPRRPGHVRRGGDVPGGHQRVGGPTFLQQCETTRASLGHVPSIARARDGVA